MGWLKEARARTREKEREREREKERERETVHQTKLLPSTKVLKCSKVVLLGLPPSASATVP